MVIFIKTHLKDFYRLEVLLESIDKYNVNNIPVHICTDATSYDDLINWLDTSRYFTYNDRDILEQAVIDGDYDPRTLRRKLNRWEVQQIVKFEFCKNMSSDNCIIIDSDNQFIKNFTEKDFMNEDGEIYTIMSTVEERCREFADDLADDMLDYRDAKTFMSAIRERVQEQFSREGEVYEFGPTPVIWSKKVVNDFYNNYLIPNKKSFVDIINLVPIEYNWYGEWLLLNKSIPLIPKKPLFKNITSQEQYDNLIEKGITTDDLREEYLGINIQSNWSKIGWDSVNNTTTGILKYEL